MDSCANISRRVETNRFAASTTQARHLGVQRPTPQALVGQPLPNESEICWFRPNPPQYCTGYLKPSSSDWPLTLCTSRLGVGYGCARSGFTGAV